MSTKLITPTPLSTKNRTQPLSQQNGIQTKNSKQNKKHHTKKKNQNEKKNKQETKEPVKVYLRLKPTTNEKKIVSQLTNDTIFIQQAPTSNNFTYSSRYTQKSQAQQCLKFKFDKIFKDNCQQKQLFQETTVPLLNDVLQGTRNCLLFAYGVTNAGKTYTMFGTKNSENKDQNNEGIIPRTLDLLFKTINETNKLPFDNTILKNTNEENKENEPQQIQNNKKKNNINNNNINNNNSTSNNNNKRNQKINNKSLKIGPNKYYKIKVSYLEIYNEKIFDLLKHENSHFQKSGLPIREDNKGNIFIEGLNEIRINNAKEGEQILLKAQENRHVGDTQIHKDSSRSHAIFQIKLVSYPKLHKNNVKLKGKNKSKGKCTNTNTGNTLYDPKFKKITHFSIMDLAGSERSKKTGNIGQQLKETSNINTSTMVLGKCIRALRDNQLIKNNDNSKCVPFRESKLTRFLKEFFLGNGRASMIVCIEQIFDNIQETINALRFATVANEVLVNDPNVVKTKTTQFVKLPSQTNHKKKLFKNSKKMQKNQKKKKPISQNNQNNHNEDNKENESIDKINFKKNHNREQNNAPRNFILQNNNEPESSNEFYFQQYVIEEIEKLKSTLSFFENEFPKVEMQIREEVASEMGERLIEMQTKYQNLRQKEELIINEKYEKKVQMMNEICENNLNNKNNGGGDNQANDSDGINGNNVDDLIKERDLLIGKIKSFEKKLLEIKKENKGLLNRLNGSKESKKNLETSITQKIEMDYEEEISNFKKKIKELNVQNENDKKQFKKIEKEKKQLLNKYNDLKTIKNKNTDQISKFKSEKKESEKEIKDLKSQLESSKKVCEKNKIEIQKLKELLKTVKKKATKSNQEEKNNKSKSKKKISPRKRKLQKKSKSPKKRRYNSKVKQKVVTDDDDDDESDDDDSESDINEEDSDDDLEEDSDDDDDMDSDDDSEDDDLNSDEDDDLDSDDDSEDDSDEGDYESEDSDEDDETNSDSDFEKTKKQKNTKKGKKKRK
ncbi:kinesin-like protein subito [Anaeramoeba flamelloides]|uniref:Kinesin-like protein subito n=1 Tax=Anaeramoeba flamelloides TaxID=1746091 RepID=A0ABQ8Y661_9EUKA|nr:kinesin-like protein subito [Anaeramoeba flamelloides]